MDIDKILDGMECCRDMNNPPGYRFRTCSTCPYNSRNEYGYGCVRQLKDDVIDLLRKLKEQPEINDDLTQNKR